ncbi:hypothetical protein [Microbacterium testaceum]|uniref:hypothetical protein n=1 Tax=Microbacterium testaceum TaxID=2033 RepID=UPI001651F1FA|nr:hypothetical protein [Microbacterium testaceum]
MTASTVATQKDPDIDMRRVLNDPGDETLTLITCDGGYLGDYSCDSREIVVATRTS